MLDCDIVNLIILICFVVLSKSTVLPHIFFSPSNMEYDLLIYQEYTVFQFGPRAHSLLDNRINSYAFSGVRMRTQYAD